MILAFRSYDKRDKRRFISSWGERVQRLTVIENLSNFALRRPVPASPMVHHLMIDDINIEKRRRVSPHDNIIRGHAREGDFSNVSLYFNSHQVLQGIQAAEAAGLIELADELSVIAVGANCETDYAISLLAALATKKKGSKAEDLAHAVKIALEEWERLGEQSRGPITTLQHDGASIMNACVFEYVTTHVIDRASAIGAIIFGANRRACLLFYDCCGNSPSHPRVDGIDAKHVAKRFRQNMKRPEGVRIKHITFRKAILSRLLMVASISNQVQLGCRAAALPCRCIAVPLLTTHYSLLLTRHRVTP